VNVKRANKRMTLVDHVKKPWTRPARADVTPETNPATNSEMSNERIAQMIKPVPTPSNGLFDVTSVTPSPIAEPIKLNKINKDRNDTCKNRAP